MLSDEEFSSAALGALAALSSPQQTQALLQQQQQQQALPPLTTLVAVPQTSAAASAANAAFQAVLATAEHKRDNSWANNKAEMAARLHEALAEIEQYAPGAKGAAPGGANHSDSGPDAEQQHHGGPTRREAKVFDMQNSGYASNLEPGSSQHVGDGRGCTGATVGCHNTAAAGCWAQPDTLSSALAC